MDPPVQQVPEVPPAQMVQMGVAAPRANKAPAVLRVPLETKDLKDLLVNKELRDQMETKDLQVKREEGDLPALAGMMVPKVNRDREVVLERAENREDRDLQVMLTSSFADYSFFIFVFNKQNDEIMYHTEPKPVL